MDGREFRSLLSHMEWADAHTWRVARTLPGGQTDDRLRWLLHHLHLVQSVYLQAWRGDPFVVTELSSYPDLPAIEAWARPFYPKAAALAESLDEARLGSVLDTLDRLDRQAIRIGGAIDHERKRMAGLLAHDVSPRAGGHQAARAWRRAATGRLPRVGVVGKARCRLVMNGPTLECRVKPLLYSSTLCFACGVAEFL